MLTPQYIVLITRTFVTLEGFVERARGAEFAQARHLCVRAQELMTGRDMLRSAPDTTHVTKHAALATMPMLYATHNSSYY